MEQPPLGGCVLKLCAGRKLWRIPAAAFRRLCVETALSPFKRSRRTSAAFRRLCVETAMRLRYLVPTAQPPLGGCVLKRYVEVQKIVKQPAAFRRLCVETLFGGHFFSCRLAAAFRRLCVETGNYYDLLAAQGNSRL